MKRTLIVLSTILVAASALSANVQKRQRPKPIAVSVSKSDREEWDRLKKRLAEYSPHISGLSWTLIHTYKSEPEMKRGLDIIESIGPALASDNPASLRKFNGPGGINQRLLNLIDSKDDTVSGFAAMMLALIGDPNHAPHIATLLDRHGSAVRDAHSEITIRGQAATALGLLRATQYSSRIAQMLKSNNRHDRAGAATALGLLKATQYAKDIAATLSNDSIGSLDDDTPIYSLVEMGVAANYKKEIAEVLQHKPFGGRAKTAAYALARLGAKEHAKDIAVLLKDDLKKGDAAKALALLGAREYTAEIVLLLEDKYPSNREDAARALGVLGAKEHAAAVAKLLKDPEAPVSIAAAQALVLMEANEYAKEALEIIGQPQSGPYLDSSDFGELVNEQAIELDNRFKALLAGMKANLSRP